MEKLSKPNIGISQFPKCSCKKEQSAPGGQGIRNLDSWPFIPTVCGGRNLIGMTACNPSNGAFFYFICPTNFSKKWRIILFYSYLIFPFF